MCGLTAATTVRIIGVCGCRRIVVESGSASVAPNSASPMSGRAREGFPYSCVRSWRARRARTAGGMSSTPRARCSGRVATLAARLLQGKHKAIYTPFIDTGDHVVIVNAGAVKLTGRKEDQKIYRRHSGYEGGLREERAGRRPQAPADSSRGGSGPRHAAEDQDGRRDVPEAEGLRRAPIIRTPPSNPRRSRSHNLASIEYYATGRRKTSTARVFLRPGNGRHHRQPPRVRQVLPDRRAAHAGPPAAAADGDRREVRHPRHGRRRRRSTVRPARCASASRARSCEFNAELRKQLKKDGLLTSDSRVKERKKYGLAGARKRFQFSKR